MTPPPELLEACKMCGGDGRWPYLMRTLEYRDTPLGRRLRELASKRAFICQVCDGKGKE